MNAFEFLQELREKSDWHKLVINDNALAGKLIEFAELYHEMKLKEKVVFIVMSGFSELERFKTKEQANEVCEYYQGKGFPDAKVVETVL